MPIPEIVQLRFLSSPEVIHRLKEELQRDQDTKILSHGKETVPSTLEFDIGSVEFLTAVVKLGLALGPLVSQLYVLLKDNPNRTIVVQSPLRRIEIQSRTDLTPEQIKEMLQKIISLQ